jgi:hypothetical protein
MHIYFLTSILKIEEGENREGQKLICVGEQHSSLWAGPTGRTYDEFAC